MTGGACEICEAINVSALVSDVEIPTIGVLNGPGFHSEIVLM